MVDTARLDEILASLREKSTEWARTSIARRVELLQAHMERFLPIAEEWAREATRQRGVDPEQNPHVVGEELMACTGVATRCIACMINTLKPAAAAEKAGKPIHVASPPDAPRTVGGGQQLAVPVLPIGFLEKQLWNGYSAELWLEPGVEQPSQAPLYTEMTAEERAEVKGVSLVLGAGNVNSITAADALHKLIVENHVVLVKMNPVNEYSTPFLEDVFLPFIEAGFVHFVKGGADVGAYLCQHELVDDVHITGSALTHDIIVWGTTAEERARNKAANTPRLNKPITSELGGVSPVIVVPGNWTEKELLYQARNVAGLVTHNLSFNCIAGKVLIVDRDWPQLERFLEELRNVFKKTPTRPAYYPGAKNRWTAFRQCYAQAEELSGGRSPGCPDGDHLPWLFIPDVPAEAGEHALTQEAFAPVLAVTQLATENDVTKFLPAAVELANTKLEGTLACVVILDPRTEREHAELVDIATHELHYGTVVFNGFGGLGFGLGVLSWGGFPGHTLQNVGSGLGQVHNTFMFERVQKSVVRAPFRMLLGIAQPWFPDHKSTLQMALNMVKFQLNPGVWNLLKTLTAALRG